MTYPWPELKFWESGEFQVIQEKIHDLVVQGVDINPPRKAWFSALSRTPLSKTKVLLLGQDPYPNPRFATGFAFSVPENIPVSEIPPTLSNILEEYYEDLGYPAPSSGNLLPWADRGVLLWNAIPTCSAGRSLSHDWVEWMYLTKEILEVVSKKGTVIVLMGNRAQRYAQYIDTDASEVIYTSHPSPLAYKGGRIPKNSFKGSRIFSTINSKLCEQGMEPVDWRLP